MKNLFSGWLLVGFILSFPAWASDTRFQARAFAGGVAVNPSSVNDELKTDGIKKISSTLMLGMEGSASVASWANLGLRYIKNQVDRDEDPSDLIHEYKAYAAQDIFMGIARFPILKSNVVLVDVFGGIGGAQTTFKLETATQSGELSKSMLSSLVSTYGVSAAVGYSKYFMFIEGGFLNNKVDGFKRSGNLNGNIQTLDLSGPYALIGFLFTDAPGLSSKK